MKIAITGPHCCGKTTVIRKVQDALDDHVKSMISFHYFSGNTAPVDYSSYKKLEKDVESELRLTYWMLSKLIERECILDSNSIIHILDRCIYDQVVYTKVLLEKTKWKPIYDFVNHYVADFPYDKIFILPVNLELLQKYGTKDRSIEYALKIQDGYLEYVGKLNDRCTFLPADQTEQVKVIIDFILDQIEQKEEFNYESRNA